MSDVGRAVQQFDVVRCAGIEIANDLDVHQCHAIEIQRDRQRSIFYLRREFIEMLRAQPTAQTYDRLEPVGNFFNP